MTADEQRAVGELSWLDGADPVADARRAIAERRFALLSLGGRGAVVPGVPPERLSELTARCGIRMVPGATDVVRGHEHLRYLHMARDYAERFNAVMSGACGAP